jgi:hypothetical protein
VRFPGPWGAIKKNTFPWLPFPCKQLREACGKNHRLLQRFFGTFQTSNIIPLHVRLLLTNLVRQPSAHFFLFWVITVLVFLVLVTFATTWGSSFFLGRFCWLVQDPLKLFSPFHIAINTLQDNVTRTWIFLILYSNHKMLQRLFVEPICLFIFMCVIGLNGRLDYFYGLRDELVLLEKRAQRAMMQ